MKVTTGIGQEDLAAVPERVKRIEALGYDGVQTNETSHNPFLALALVAEHSSSLRLSTSIAQSFVRSPTTMAYAAFDLQRFSKGRLWLGMGSQVKGQIERRFGMPWTAPGPRMRDYIGAMRAVFDCWQEKKQLDYQGTHYKLSVMTPNHRPSPLPEGLPVPRIELAAVGPYMCRLVGEVCDGVDLHTFNTAEVVKYNVLPNIEEGLKRSGRTMADLEISGGGMIATGPDEAAVQKAIDGVRWSVAFYGSTRTYLSVWKLHGWEETGLKLHELSVTNGWDKMAALITDEMVEAFAAVGTYEQIGDKILERFGSFATSVGLPLPALEHEAKLLPSIRLLQSARNPWEPRPNTLFAAAQ
jgi:probable F420-dependent oxidoreductase